MESRFRKWPRQWKVGQFEIHTTVLDPKIEVLAQQLLGLSKQIESTLLVPVDPSDVQLVVLQDQAEFELYLKTHFPNLPTRRALYYHKRGLGVVLTYMHEEWLTDARHECTHALLHQSNVKLPLWLDEGIAEYFETPIRDPHLHPDHLNAVQAQIRYGQIVDLDSLEQANHVYLEAKDYRDAWSVVNMLIHHSPETHQALTQYISDLTNGTAAGFLSRRLPKEIRTNWRQHYLDFYATRTRSPHSSTASLAVGKGAMASQGFFSPDNLSIRQAARARKETIPSMNSTPSGYQR